jgi:hypothetical protein
MRNPGVETMTHSFRSAAKVRCHDTGNVPDPLLPHVQGKELRRA